MNPSSATFGWAILVATFLGPVAAVLVTRYVDRLREEYQRRLSIFRTLMATRAAGLTPERVTALNMIQIDFAKDRDVMSAQHELLGHFGKSVPTNEAEHLPFHQHGTHLLTILLHQMAKSLGFKIEQLDILDRVYHPVGMVQVAEEQEAIRCWLAGLATGRQALPVIVFQPLNTAGTGSSPEPQAQAEGPSE